MSNVDYYQTNQFYRVKIDFIIFKFCFNGTTIFNILDNTTELYMTKYIIGEIFSSGRATLYKNISEQTVQTLNVKNILLNKMQKTWILERKFINPHNLIFS